MKSKNASSVLNYSLFITLTSTILTAIAPLVAVFVDGLFAGNLLGEEAFGAVNLILPVSNLMMVIALICNMGGSMLAAKALAVDDDAKGSKYFTLSLASSTLIAWLCTAALYFNLDSVSAFLCPSAEGVGFVRDYLSVLLVYFLFLPLATTFNNMVQMEGHPQLTTRIVVASNAVNILLDFVLVSFFHLGIRGIAWATVVSGMLNALLYIPHFLKGGSHYRLMKITLADLSLLKASLLNGIGFNLFYIMTNTFAFLVNAFLFRALGADGVKIFGLCLQIQSVTFCVVVGVCIGGIAQINMLNGEGDSNAMRHVFKRLTTLNILFYALLAVIMTIFAPAVAQMFGISDPAMLHHCRLPLACFSVYYLCFAIVAVQSTISYQLMGHVGAKAVYVFLTGTLAYLFIRLFSRFSPDLLWLGFPIGGLLALLATVSFAYRRYLRNRTLTRFSLMSRLPSEIRVELAVDYACSNLPAFMEQAQLFNDICELPATTQLRVKVCCTEFLELMKSKKLSAFANHFLISMREKEDRFLVTIKSAGPPCTLHLAESQLSHQKESILDLSEEEFGQLMVNVLPDDIAYQYNFGLNITTLKWQLRPQA